MMTEHEIQLPQGAIRYRESGQGEPLVFLHGLLVNGRLWDGVVAALDGEFRCVVPELPLGSHTLPMPPGADLSPLGVARLVADFLEALDLRDVTLVGNDTGGAICQIVATRHPERVGRLVLTPCDVLEVFPPKMFKPLVTLARTPRLATMLLQPLRLSPARRLPNAYGWLSKRRPPRDIEESWVRPFFSDPAVRRDTFAVLRGADARQTLQAAEDLQRFDKPVLLAWAADDKFFSERLGRRFAEPIPNARLELVADSRTFLPLDQPQRLAELVREFVREPVGAPA